MRQAGIIAAAGIVALEKMVNRLADDHTNAYRLAHGLASIPGISIDSEKVLTNIVMFELAKSTSGAEFVQRANTKGVRFISRGGQTIRAVTHRMISDKDVDEALERILLLMSESG